MSYCHGGGKNRKVAKHPGRPSGETPKTVLSHVNTIVPEPFLPPDDPTPTLYQNTTTEPLCPICLQLLDGPLQLGCGNIICLRCCRSWIQLHHPPLSCPCCYKILDSEHVTLPPPLVLSLVEGVLVHCVKGCGKIVQVRQYQQHLKGACQTHYHQLADSPSKMTISEVLSRPSTSPATPAEVRVAEHLVKKIIDQSSGESSEGVFKIPRRGEVSKLLCIVTKNIITLYLYKITANHLSAIAKLPSV